MYYPASNYYGYFYAGYDVSFGEWVDQGYILGADRLDLQYPGIQVENESVVYYIPGYGYVQLPLNPYFSPPVIGVDVQFLGQQPYFPSPLFPQVAAPGYLPSPIPYRSEVVPAYSWDPSLLVVGSQINGISGVPVPPSPKSTLSAPNPTSVSAYVKPTQKIMSSTHIEAKASPPSSYSAHGQCGLPVASIHNQSLKAVNKVTLQGAGFQPTAVLANGYFPITKFPAYSNPSMGRMLYSNCPMGFKTNGQGWAGSEKLKAISKSIGLGDFDLLNEQNRGPRKNNSKDSWISDVDVVGCLGSGDTSESNNFNVVIRKDQYNLPDLPIKFDQALFFVIKSYSEDAIHMA